MTQVVIDDVIPRTQSIATAGQTQFNTNWTADAATDILVYARAEGVTPDDVTQLISSTLYNVTFVGGSQIVRVTFLSGRALNDVVTIVRNTPADRMNLYINTNFTPSMLNEDFGNLTLVDQQAQMYDTVVNPGYNVSATIDPIIDTVLPILEENQIWAKNNDNTAFIPYDVPSTGILAPGDAKYIIQEEHPDLPNAQALDSLPDGMVSNHGATGVLNTVTITGTALEIDVGNGTGQTGNPTIGIVDNPLIPGSAGMGIPSGTTAQRVTPTPPSIGLRFNTDVSQIEAYIGGNWVLVPSAAAGLFLPLTGGSMAGDIDMNGNFIHNLPAPASPDDAATADYVDTGLAAKLDLAGGTMTGDIQMDGHIIDGLPLPTGDDEAASKIYVDNVVGGAAGGVTGNMQWNNGDAFAGDPNFNTDGAGNATIDGSLEVDNIRLDANRISATTGTVELEDAELFNDMDAGTNKIVNLAAPTNDADAVNKAYVDALVAGLNFLNPAYAATTINLAGYVYANGASGVGATLTAGGNGAFSVDGVSPALNARILVKNQTTTFQNGVYVLTTVGTVSTPAVLTRAADYDTPAEITPGDYIVITNGSTQSNSSWIQTAVVASVGVDAITFSQFTVAIPVPVTQGGTGRTSLDAYRLVAGGTTSTGAAQSVNAGTNGQLLQSKGSAALPDYTTATYPSTVTANNILYASGSNTVGQLTPGTGVLTGLQTAVNTSGGFATTALTGSAGHFCKNLMIGGDFGTNPWQRGTSFPAIATTAYCADRWRLFSGGTTAVTTASKSSDAPTIGLAGILSTSSLLFTVTTADNAIAAGDVFSVVQTIEGYNFTRIAQQVFTISFCVKATVTGTYCVSFVSTAAGVSYVGEYVVNATNTWEYKTITISASPSAGSWDYTNGAGLTVAFNLACGSTFQTTAGAWNSGTFWGTANQVNALATIGNTFQVDLIQVEAGSVATPFETRTIQEELLLCQRYYWKTFNQTTAPAQGGGLPGVISYRAVTPGATPGATHVSYPSVMRTTPTITSYNPASANALWRNTSASTDSGAFLSINPGDSRFNARNAQAAGDAVGQDISIQVSANAEF